MAGKTPRVPPENQAHKGTGSEPKLHDQAKPDAVPENTAEQAARQKKAGGA